MKSIVYNTNLAFSPFASEIDPRFLEYTSAALANIFEQLMLFDKVVISTNTNNLALVFLIRNIGIDTVEKLFRSNFLQFTIPSTIIMGSVGKPLGNNEFDDSKLMGRISMSAAALNGSNIDPEENVNRALQRFNLPRAKNRELRKLIASKYIDVNENDLGIDAVELVENAYYKNNLANIGLPFIKDLEDLNSHERQTLLATAADILNMAVTSQNGFSSYNNYNHLMLAQSTYANIGDALKISGDASEILKIENTPNLESLFLSKKFIIDDVFRLRNLSNAKYFRKWIREIDSNISGYEVTEAYLREIMSARHFLDTNLGKFIKTTGVFAATTALSAAAAGVLGIAAAPVGAVLGLTASKLLKPAFELGLGYLEAYTLGSMLKGNNPKSFIDAMKLELKGKY